MEEYEAPDLVSHLAGGYIELCFRRTASGEWAPHWISPIFISNLLPCFNRIMHSHDERTGTSHFLGYAQARVECFVAALEAIRDHKFQLDFDDAGKVIAVVREDACPEFAYTQQMQGVSKEYRLYMFRTVFRIVAEELSII